MIWSLIVRKWTVQRTSDNLYQIYYIILKYFKMSMPPFWVLLDELHYWQQIICASNIAYKKGNCMFTKLVLGIRHFTHVKHATLNIDSALILRKIQHILFYTINVVSKNVGNMFL